MGACFHIDGVECDNCRGIRGGEWLWPPPRAPWVPPTTTTGATFALPIFATKTDVDALAAEVQRLTAEVAKLTRQKRSRKPAARKGARS